MAEKRQLSQLSKAELVRLATSRCEHRHLLIEHPQCDEGPKENIGFIDIETSNLTADYGYVLTWAIKAHDSNDIFGDCIQPEDLAKCKDGDEDKRIVKSLVTAMEKFDTLVGFYSSK